MLIKIFVTGGTFDKEYHELDGKLFFKKTHLAASGLASLFEDSTQRNHFAAANRRATSGQLTTFQKAPM